MFLLLPKLPRTMRRLTFLCQRLRIINISPWHQKLKILSRLSSQRRFVHFSCFSPPYACPPIFSRLCNQYTQKKAKAEASSSDLGGMGVRRLPANPNFGIAFGTGHPFMINQPMYLGGFPGTSHDVANLFGCVGPSFHPVTTANPTAGPHSNGINNEHGGHGGSRRPSNMSGMTPMLFGGGVPANIGMAAAPAPLAHPAVMQVVSSDSASETITDIAGRRVHQPRTQVAMVPAGNAVQLQKPKKWVRWSEQEDTLLRRAVYQWGEGAFGDISEQIFRGSRTDTQCKNRWKTVQVGKWAKEEDKIIVEEVHKGTEWCEIAQRLPFRTGDQVKDRWTTVLDPNLKSGVWTEAEMQTLRESQKELGNNWSDIAKRIPGRTETSVKNRWYNQRTTDRRAAKKLASLPHIPQVDEQDDDQASSAIAGGAPCPSMHPL